MIDFHSHILPGVDDGPQDIKESKLLLEEAKKYGFDRVISTSHYAVGCYEVPEYKRIELLNELKQIKDAPQLFLGSEIFITFNIVNLLKEFKASTINGTSYVLFELPLRRHFPNYKDIIRNLKENDYRPILAHPERYADVQKDFDILYDLQGMGVKFQVNFASFLGYYGLKAKWTAKKMLQNKLIDFMGTDVHRPNTKYPNVHKALNKMAKYVDEDYIRDITQYNAEKILRNEEIWYVLYF